MRLNEIDNSTIDIRLKTFFNIDGEYSINDGIVNVDGNVKLIKQTTRLPVKFGIISGLFDCGRKNLTSLIGSPTEARNFKCENNKLTSLVGGPKIIGNSYLCFNNPLQSLDGVPTEMAGWFAISYSSNLPLLRLVLINGVKRIAFTKGTPISSRNIQYIELSEVLNKYLGKGKAGAIQCAAELSKLGFKENARL